MTCSPSPATLGLYALTFALVLFAVGGSAHAESAQEALRRAQNAFNYQEYGKAQTLLESLLSRKKERPGDEDERLARKLLGACYWRAKQLDKARLEFTTVLVKDHAAKLSAFVHPSALIEFFEALRSDLIRRGIIKDVRVPAPKKQKMLKLTLRKNIYALNFIPFGVGQFQNRQPTKGALFAVFQSVTLATNIAAYLYIELKLINRNGTVTNVSTAKALQVTQYVALGAFLGLVTWGIIDAVVNYKPIIVLNKEIVTQPPTRLPEKRSGKQTRFYIAPMPLRGGANVQFGLQF